MPKPSDDFNIPQRTPRACQRAVNPADSFQSEVRTKNRSFLAEFQLLYQSSDAAGISVRTAIHRYLSQFKLRQIDTIEVLDEVFIRGERLTASGEVQILNVPAWARRTAFNYIRELTRQQKRTGELDREVPDESSNSWLDRQTYTIDRALLNLSLQRLDSEEKRLLHLKIVEACSWTEIQLLFQLQGKTISVTALRKKKERALKRLRQIYHSLKPLAELSCPLYED